MTTARVALAVVLAAAALAGALPAPPVAAQAPADATFEDPADDAREYNGQYAAGVAGTSCARVAGRTPAAFACFLGYAAPPAGGVPARPHLELLGGSIVETDDHLVVELRVASFDEGWSVPEDAADSPVYAACWGAEVVECTYAYAYRTMSDAVVVEAVHDVYSTRCNDWGWCTRAVEYETEFGAPGALRLRVPRAYLWAGEPGDILRGATLAVGLQTGTPVAAARAEAAGRAAGAGAGGIVRYETDRSEPQDVVLGLPRPALAPGEGPARFADPPDADSPQWELLDLVVVESPQTFTLAQQLGEVSAAPRDHGYYATFGLPSGRVFEAWYEAKGGLYQFRGGVCLEYDDNRACTRYVNPEPQFDLAVGAPGWVNITFDRGVLGTIARGDATNMLWSAAGPPRAAEPLLPGPADVQATASTEPWRPVGDWTAGLPSYVFQQDSVPAERPEFFVPDGLGDTTLPELVDPSLASQFDVTFLAVNGAPGETRFVVGVEDLSSLRVPLGYRALLYAAAVETEDGQFMAAFYQEGGGRQEIFCSQDTAVLTEDGRDPMAVVRQPIQAVLNAAGGTDERARSSGGRGSITFFVPHSCFTRPDAAALSGERAGGGAYLVGADGALFAADEVETDRTVPLGLAAVAAPTPPWYAEPFGLANFWDIFGIAAAVATSAGGVALVKRRQNALRRWLREVDDTVRAHPSLPARQRALLALEARLKEALERGRLPEGHFVIVERRVEACLREARAKAVGEAFGELPARLLVQLQEMIADGVITRDEHRLFCALLEDTDLKDEAKVRFRRKLDLWVAENVETAAPAGAVRVPVKGPPAPPEASPTSGEASRRPPP